MATIEASERVTSNLIVSQTILALGGLFIGTGEFAAMGMLPDLAASVGSTVPQAGHIISAYALGVVVGSPVLAVLAARVERRLLLVLLALIVAVGNAATAMAWSFESLVVARFVSGLPHGAYYGTAAIVAASMVAQERKAQAIGRVMLGLAAANLAGVPAITALGQELGWRYGFGVIAIGAVVVALLLPWAVGKVPAERDASPRRELSALANGRVWMTLASAAIGFGGMFAVYSYITPTLTDYTGQPSGSVPYYLSLWGLGMVVGNIAGSWLADRHQTRAILGLMLWNVLFLGLFVPAASSGAAVAVVLFLIGIGFGLVPALQARLMDVAPGAQSLAAAMNHSAFNLSNAIGAWAGGLALSTGWGWSSTGGVAAILAAGGLAIFLVALAVENNHPRSVSHLTSTRSRP